VVGFKVCRFRVVEFFIGLAVDVASLLIVVLFVLFFFIILPAAPI
jgi:hypothetical protein